MYLRTNEGKDVDLETINITDYNIGPQKCREISCTASASGSVLFTYIIYIRLATWFYLTNTWFLLNTKYIAGGIKNR